MKGGGRQGDGKEDEGAGLRARRWDGEAVKKAWASEGKVGKEEVGSRE